jgi:hypothetical protein
MWVVVALQFLMQFILGAHVFPAYRLVQFDKSGQQFGSRRTVLNQLATVLRPGELEASEAEPEEEILQPFSGSEEEEMFSDFEDDEPRAEKIPAESIESSRPKRSKRKEDGELDLARSIVVVPINGLTSSKLLEITEKRGASGILILLEPAGFEATSAQVDRWKRLERYLLSRSFDIPIYFTVKDSVVSEIFATLQSHSTLGEAVVDRYQLVAAGPEAVELGPVTSATFQATLAGAAGGEQTIALVANYDTFGAAPGLAFGVDQNGSGTVALLELIRIFSRLYSDVRMHGNFNLLFVLTGADRLNFAGVKQWLKTADKKLLESLKLVLCLEAIGASSDLYLHVSKNISSPEMKPIADSFVSTAKTMQLPLEVRHRRINASSAVGWPHELFARKRILAATLSSRAQPSPLFSAASIFDTRERVDSAQLQRNIKFIAEVLCQQLYGNPGLEVIQDSLGVNPHFVSSWLDFLGAQARTTQYLSQNDDVMTHIDRVLKQSTSDVKKLTFVLDNGFKFYKGTPEEMSAYKVKPMTFDIFLAIVIVVYLGCFHLYFQEEPLSVTSILNAFSGRKKRN